jgi:F420H(2)-dependent biliverdin reductase
MRILMASLPRSATLGDPALQPIIAAFAAAECCWFSTVRADGRPHLAPIWHVWHESSIFVVTQRRSVRAGNLRHNPSASLALPDPMNPIIIEGVAHFAPAQRATLQPLFQQKYNWDIETDHEYDTVIEVVPRKIMAWGSYGDGRWTIT